MGLAVAINLRAASVPAGSSISWHDRSFTLLLYLEVEARRSCVVAGAVRSSSLHRYFIPFAAFWLMH